MSGIRSILLHQDGSARARSRLEVALRLAKTCGAEVTALYAVSSIYAQFPFAIASSTEAAAVLCDIEDASLARARSAFEDATRECGVKTRWASVVLEAERVFARQGSYADLLVLGQRDPDSREAAYVPPAFVESVLIESGRPARAGPPPEPTSTHRIRRPGYRPRPPS